MQIVKLRLELFNNYKTDKDLAPNVQKWSTIVQFQLTKQTIASKKKGKLQKV